MALWTWESACGAAGGKPSPTRVGRGVCVVAHRASDHADAAEALLLVTGVAHVSRGTSGLLHSGRTPRHRRGHRRGPPAGRPGARREAGVPRSAPPSPSCPAAAGPPSSPLPITRRWRSATSRAAVRGRVSPPVPAVATQWTWLGSRWRRRVHVVTNPCTPVRPRVDQDNSAVSLRSAVLTAWWLRSRACATPVRQPPATHAPRSLSPHSRHRRMPAPVLPDLAGPGRYPARR
jgi:hypothetical protein